MCDIAAFAVDWYRIQYYNASVFPYKKRRFLIIFIHNRLCHFRKSGGCANLSKNLPAFNNFPNTNRAGIRHG